MARILVIDDNADLLQMIRMFLEEKGGHEVILSAEGPDGLEKAFAHPPDLAIVDVMMPGMTGYEVCRRLRQEPSTADVPILILTARGQSVDKEAALEAGADEYLAKPVTMGELLRRVNGLLAQKEAERAAPLEGLTACLSLRGGVGVTTLAVNLAVELAPRSPDQVCLLDLSPSSGHAALQLGLRPKPDWSKLVSSGVQTEGEGIREYLLPHPSGLHLLAAPFVPVVGGGPSARAVRSILSGLRQRFRAVVVDLPSVLEEGVMAALEMADHILLVTAADPPSIQTTVGTLQALKPLGGKVKLVLNQVAPGPLPPLEALQRVLKRPLEAAIPFDPAQAQALGQGQPLVVSSPASPLAREVSRLAAKLAAARVRPAAG